MSVFVCLCVVVSRERSDVKSEREREERLSGHEIWEYAWRFLDFFFGFKETSGDKRVGKRHVDLEWIVSCKFSLLLLKEYVWDSL